MHIGSVDQTRWYSSSKLVVCQTHVLELVAERVCSDVRRDCTSKLVVIEIKKSNRWSPVVLPRNRTGEDVVVKV
jgi:hypothetical protein